MNSTPATSSMTGSVFGRHTMLVTPPAAAAMLAVAIVSLCSSPGSRSCTRMSIRPGARQRPPASMRSKSSDKPCAFTCGPTSAITPSCTSIPPCSSRLLAGSSRRALRMASGRARVLSGFDIILETSARSFLSFLRKRDSRATAPSLALDPRFRGGDKMGGNVEPALALPLCPLCLCGVSSSCRRLVRPQRAREHVEAGHAHGDAHLHLLADQAAVDVVGHFAVDLDAAVHRPGMHDEGVRLGGGQLVVVEAEEVEVFADRRHEAALHALGLQPQHHHDVAIP